MKLLIKDIKTTFKNIIKDTFLSALLALSTGIFIGVIAFNSSLFQASLLQTETTLEPTELAFIFTEVDNIKDIKISNLSATSYFVEFLATEGLGDSLHPYSYVVTKENNTIISVNEVVDSVKEELLF